MNFVFDKGEDSFTLNPSKSEGKTIYFVVIKFYTNNNVKKKILHYIGTSLIDNKHR